MNYGKPYRDVMDDSRILVPRSANGAEVSCSVYFRGKENKFDYFGMTNVSVNLFTGTKYDPHMPERIGFMPLE